jgi:hypothetical protein
MDIVRTGKDAAASILGLTQALLQKHASRIPGTQGARDAAASIVHILRQFCDHASAEDFTLHPGSLFNIGRIVCLAYVLAFCLLLMGGVFVYISLAVCLWVFAYAVIHYFRYGSLFDRLFKKQAGCNAVGVIEPAGEVRRQVIVCGHHDSPHIFNYLSRFGKLAGIRFLLAILFYIFITVVSLAAALQEAIHATAWRLDGATLVLSLAGLLFLLPLFFFISTKASPGAGDNLNGSSIALHIGKYFAGKKAEGGGLRHTRLIVLSADGEEAGQRGAIAYVTRHRQELADIPAHVINIDSVYTLRDLAVLLNDRHGFLPLSPQMAKDCTDIAAALGYSVKAIRAPFGSGTDAAAFAKAGIEATTLIGMPTSLFAGEFIYHTARDTVDTIAPEAVAAVFDIAVNYILGSDGSTV